MFTKRFSFLILILLLVLTISACQTASQEKNDNIVYTSIYPLYEVANRVSGDNLTVKLIVPNGAEVHSYRPTSRQIANVEDADLLFYNGLGLEPWAKQVTSNLNQTTVINISEIVNLIEYSDTEEHEEHEEHGQYDPHLWLNPANMKLIANEMKERFIELDPANKKEYQQNQQQFISEVDKLDQAYQSTLKNKKQDYILVSHSAFGYLAQQYGFEQLSVTGVSPHQEPSPHILAELTKRAEENNLEYIFMETLASPKTVNVLAEEANLEVLELNPIAGLREKDKKNNEDYFSLMYHNLANLEKALVN